MDEIFKTRLEKNAAKHGYELGWENLRFGFQRAVVETTSWKNHEETRKWAMRIHDAHIEDSYASSQYAFTGHVCIMPDCEWRELDTKIKEEFAASLAWNERYHVACEIAGREHAGSIAENTSTVEEAVKMATQYN